jgi:glycosyltransferase involved in cell wall biosynthesis
LGPKLSIVVPAHDEASRLEGGFRKLSPAIDELGPELVEVIVIDDGSIDGSGPIAAGVYGHLPHLQIVRHEANRGKGAAVRLGLSIATAPKIIVCDADMAIDPSHIPAVLEQLNDSPIVFGSRAVDGEILYGSWLRTRAGALFNAIVRREIDTDLRDTQCGFKGLRSGAARLLACLGVINGFAYDVEIIHLAALAGLDIATVPVTWEDVRGSSVRPFSDSPRMMRDIRSIRQFSYSALAVRTERGLSLDRVAATTRAARAVGLVIASGEDDDLVIVPRDGALVASAIATAVSGNLGTVNLRELRGRELIAI